MLDIQSLVWNNNEHLHQHSGVYQLFPRIFIKYKLQNCVRSHFQDQDVYWKSMSDTSSLLLGMYFQPVLPSHLPLSTSHLFSHYLYTIFVILLFQKRHFFKTPNLTPCFPAIHLLNHIYLFPILFSLSFPLQFPVTSPTPLHSQLSPFPQLPSH